MINYLELLSKMSIRARFAYGVLCLENALTHENIITNDYELLNKLWEFTNSHQLDEWDEMIKEVSPFCLMDENVDYNDFIGGRDFVNKYLEFYKSIPRYIVNIIDLCIDIGTINLYGGVIGVGTSTLEPTMEIINISLLNNVPLPPIETLSRYSFEYSNGWGAVFTKNDLIET